MGRKARGEFAGAQAATEENWAAVSAELASSLDELRRELSTSED
jgi:hypothetical protein